MSYTTEILQLALRGTNKLSSIAQVLNQKHRLKGGFALKDSNVRSDAKLASCTEFAGGKVTLKKAGKVNCSGCVFSGGELCPVPLDVIGADRRVSINPSKGADDFHHGRVYGQGEASSVNGKSARFLK